MHIGERSIPDHRLHVALIIARNEEGNDALIANRREQRLVWPQYNTSASQIEPWSGFPCLALI